MFREGEKFSLDSFICALWLGNVCSGEWNIKFSLREDTFIYFSVENGLRIITFLWILMISNGISTPLTYDYGLLSFLSSYFALTREICTIFH